MKIGVMMWFTEYSMTPAELAISVEERGLESLWFPEHSHIPLPRVSPWQGGGELPKFYYELLDPFVSIGAAAAVTKKIKLATGICLVGQRDPIQVAKVVASIDQISNGRFLFGVGGGWNAEEMANHGTTDFKARFKLMDERVEAIQTVWGNEKPEYHGQFVEFGPMMTWPKPMQKPNPPIIVGGGFPYGARRAIRYGDGWMPLGGRIDVIGLVPKFRLLASQLGRDPSKLSITSFLPELEEDYIAKASDSGVDRIVFGLLPQSWEAVFPLLDKFAEMGQKWSS